MVALFLNAVLPSDPDDDEVTEDSSVVTPLASKSDTDESSNQEMPATMEEIKLGMDV